MQVIPLSNIEQAANDANLKVILTYEDLTDADTSQTIELFPVFTKDLVRLKRYELRTVFDAGTSDTIIVGDGNSTNRFLTSTEMNATGTEIFQKSGALTDAAGFQYTADDTVDAIIASVGANLDTATTGEVHLYFQYEPYKKV